MADFHLASNGQTSQKQPLVCVAWDLQNVKCKQNNLPNWAINLLDFCRQQGRFSGANVYYNSQHKDQSSAKDKLERFGYKCVDVPDPSKNSADNRLIADCINQVAFKPSPDIIILVLGDRDFAGLICVLRSLGKKVIVFAQRGNESKKLMNIVDEFHFIDELPQLVGIKTKPKTDGVFSYITYEDAIACLLEAIKTALSQHKHTGFSLINNLMRNNKRFPNYQGINSIRKSDGKTFSRFSNFLNAVEAEGKVKMKNQELFLAE
ncbi:MAG: NYN domain-containing protein [Aphanothece sp. CMT-3BRIN-NPC111]|jgi:hypothetical protein|nr:NYN domain-containing protein [Aphanothece sp. CMT-3BRIN-NPC111]